MADNESFFRKVVRFVANPATDWSELNSRQEDTRELELEKTELKAMIERKRRNDFVRKREFDMLRRIRREGLSPEQLAALGTSSRLDDSEARLPDSAARADSGVKAKIDEIEQQMASEGSFASTRRPASFYEAPTEPAGLPSLDLGDDDEQLPPLPPLPDTQPPPVAPSASIQVATRLPPLSPVEAAPPPAPAAAPAPVAKAAPPLVLPPAGRHGLDDELAVEVCEVVHDPELDEAVISFANADFAACEHSLQQLMGPGGSRAHHAETWLVLFDLYRATGQQQRFESLAMDYVQQFGWSAPQWYSLPKLVADAVSEEPSGPASRVTGEVGWVCPEVLDVDAVARLRSQTLQMPLPWIFDWGVLRRLDPEAAMQLSTLFRLWAAQPLEMRWLSGERLFEVLQEAAPTGVRDADPAYWITRLDGLRLANRADQFDETAIDYCVTYEVSPPSWEAARCKVRISGSSLTTRTPPLSVVGEVSTSFHETGVGDEGPAVTVAHVELSGQLVGDIGETLNRLSAGIGQAPLVSVSCARLIRVDFIAAGDLLNWVLGRRGDGRAVHFIDAHRLVALFFGAMGINEHARVQLRKV
jgi:hypothetical protein